MHILDFLQNTHTYERNGSLVAISKIYLIVIKNFVLLGQEGDDPVNSAISLLLIGGVVKLTYKLVLSLFKIKQITKLGLAALNKIAYQAEVMDMLELYRLIKLLVLIPPRIVVISYKGVVAKLS